MDICEKLDLKAKLIMGKDIGFGSEVSLMLEASEEIQTLRAKVEVLVEALREIERRDCYCDGWESCKNNYQAIASNAIATYEKITEVKE